MKLKRKIFYKYLYINYIIYKIEKTSSEKILLFIYNIFLYIESLFFWSCVLLHSELIYFYHILKMYI